MMCGLMRAAGAVVFGCLSAFAQQYLISTVAGGAPPPVPMPAVSASIGQPNRVAVSAAGEVFFTSLKYVFKVDRAGVLSRVAADAILQFPYGIAADAAGNVYFGDGVRVWKAPLSGPTTLVAGNGLFNVDGDGGPAAEAQLSVSDIAVDAGGNLFIADNLNQRIRRISVNGVITTVATTAANVSGLAFDASGNLLLADQFTTSFEGGRIRKLMPDGTLSTVRNVPFTPTGGLTVDPVGNIYFGSVAAIYKITQAGDLTSFTDLFRNGVAAEGLASDTAGNVYAADGGRHKISKISPSGAISDIAGNGTVDFSGDGGPALNAQLASPAQIALDAAGNFYFVDRFNYRIRKVASDGGISTVAGSSLNYVPDGGDGGPATSAVLSSPRGVAIDSKGNLYVSEFSRIRKISSSGVISTFLTNGIADRFLFEPSGLIVDAVDNLYVAYSGFVFKVAPEGVITTVAGGGNSLGDGGAATAAGLAGPQAIALDSSGNLYIADTRGNRVRKVSAAGIISTVAGNGFSCLNAGGGVTDLCLNSPAGVGVDRAGNVYISDTGNPRVLKVSPAGVLTTIAGRGTSVADGLALAADLTPGELAVTASGDIYVSDATTNSIRLLRRNGPALAIISITNAASNVPGPIAPGEIVTIYGAGIGPARLALLQLTANGLVDRRVAETRVLFDGISAPLIYASDLQTAAVVPYSVSGSSVQVVVEYQGIPSQPVTVPLAPSAPGIFILSGQRFVTPTVVTHAGEFLTLYVTGEGQTSPPGVDGKPASVPLPQPVLPVSVTIGGKEAVVQYAGGTPGLVAGLMQVNVLVPDGVEGDVVPVVVRVGQARSQPGPFVRVFVK
ncbi:MAG: hypothetical protein ABI822_12230 [Bryobacteraceae bacterium]